MSSGFAVYMVLSFMSLGLLATLLPLVLLPSFLTGVPSRDFGPIHTSVVLVALLKSAFVILEIFIFRQHNPYKMGKACDVDSMATAVLTMAIVAHFPLLAINTHVKVTTRDNARQKLFSTMCSSVLLFSAYAYTGLFIMGILISWGEDTAFPLGLWAGVHCVPPIFWWRIGRIVSLFVPLVLTVAISIPCVLSVTLRHRLFKQRDVTNIRIEVGTLLFVSACAMSFMIVLWANTGATWPRPLEGALGILVFLIVLNESVLKCYAKWGRWLFCCGGSGRFHCFSAARYTPEDDEENLHISPHHPLSTLTLGSTVARSSPRLPTFKLPELARQKSSRPVGRW